MRDKMTVKAECRRVNHLLRDEAEKLQLGVKGVSLQRLEQSRNDQAVFSYWASKEFQEYVRRTLDERQAVSQNYLINEGARKLGLSPVTTKRYMSALRTANGPFGGLGDIVVINANYVPVEEDPYWTEATPEAEHEEE
jgi:hypothetical protein